MAAAHSHFPPTQWTAIIEAARSAVPLRREQALGELCREYWRPLFAFSRRLGFDRHDAEDLTQGFFAYLLQNQVLDAARRDMGTLRTFLLTVFQRYIRDVRDHERAEKRGGGQPGVAFDVAEGEVDLAAADTPERAFDRTWAQAILRGALGMLAEQERSAGRAAQFQVLEPYLNPAAEAEQRYARAAEELRMNADAVRQIVSRLRRKFRDCLRERIAATLQQPNDGMIDEELLALKAALRQ